MSFLKNKKVLITCGPTWVALDSVRVLSNVSSGAFGYAIAERFIKEKAKVTILQGQLSVCPSPKGARIISYTYFDELFDSLKKELKHNVDIVVHAAAVSDFKPKKKAIGKIKSDGSLKLELVPTPKIINSIKRIDPKVFLVGFKLEPGLSEKKAIKEAKGLFKDSRCDLVVANSIDKNYRGFLVQGKKVLAKADSRKKMAGLLVKAIKKLL